MLKNYRITVNGVAYDVTVEETNGSVAPSPAAVPASVPAAPAAASAPAVQSSASARADGNPVKAPMNGTILKMNVKVGDTVKKDDVVCILEAMKMENEIFAPQDGTVTAVTVQKGAAVNADDVLLTIK